MRILIMLLILTGCATGDWTINGVEVESFKRIDTDNKMSALAGGLTSVVVHWVGHIGYATVKNISWHQEGLNERITQYISRSELSNFGRAGFISQLSVGYLLNKFLDRGSFLDGYNSMTLIEIGTYVVYDSGDLWAIGKTRFGEWAAYSALALKLMDKKETFYHEKK